MNGPEQRAALALEQGMPWRDALEALLRELPLEQAEEWMMRLNEGRGSFALTLAGTGGRALFLGEPLSGTVVALEMLGFRVHHVARSARDLRIARGRGRDLCPGGGAGLVADVLRLPFRDGAFDLVVHEGAPDGGWTQAMPELGRVTAGELVLVGDNPLAYKRGLGRRGRFQHASPGSLARGMLRPNPGERSLRGYRRLLRSQGFAGPRAFAPYPHALEFSHLVGLDGKGPELTIGPRERKNRIKLLGHRLGLFPAFAPSFCVHGSRRTGAARLERVLGAVAERSGLRPGPVEHLVATRSNTALALTRGPDPLCLHVPLSPSKRRLIATHHRFLVRMTRDYPEVPVPEAIFCGSVEDTWVQAERRLGGLTAPHLTGQADAEHDLLVSVADWLAKLTCRPAAPLDQATLDRLLGQRCAEVRRRCGVPATERALEDLFRRASERLVGRRLPLVLYHADVRAKHVQTDGSAKLLGLLDWGASESEFLPMADLGHWLVHQRKQTRGGTVGDAWRALRRPDAREPGEHEAISRYSDALGLDLETQGILLELVPVFIAGMAERNWDYSRPTWVHRQFGLGSRTTPL